VIGSSIPTTSSTCFEEGDGVRINYSEGVGGRDHCVVVGSLAEFAKAVAAVRVG